MSTDLTMMFLGTLGASLVGNLLARKVIVRASSRNQKGRGIARDWKTMGFLMPPDPLANFEIQRYYQNEPKFNGVFSRNNLPKTIKDGTYVTNLDEYADVGKHWACLVCNGSEIVYFDNFGFEHVSQEIK